jgi:uncharacterized protein
VDQEVAVDIARRYADKVRQRMKVRKILLYGSQANGTARDDSDIDIAVIVRGLKGDWLSKSTRLWLLTRDVDVRIEPRLLDELHGESGFLEHILSYGEVIYDAANDKAAAA